MATGGGGGGGGVRRRRRKAGLPGFCWKTCYFPLLFWVVSACGEEKTFIVEVSEEVCVRVLKWGKHPRRQHSPR